MNCSGENVPNARVVFVVGDDLKAGVKFIGFCGLQLRYGADAEQRKVSQRRFADIAQIGQLFWQFQFSRCACKFCRNDDIQR